jgi:lysozyme
MTIVARHIIFDAARQLGAKFRNADDVAVMDRAIDEALREAVATVPAPRPSQGLGRRVSKAMVDKMHGFEGCVLEAYPDPGSKDGHPWTIGRGATGAGIGPGVKWTQEQADARFLSDLAKFEDGVTRLIGSAPTTQSQFDALVSLAYNIGLDEDADTIAEGLGDSTLLRKHKAGDFEGAAKAFLSWSFNDGRQMRGLLARRKAESAHYRGDA